MTKNWRYHYRTNGKDSIYKSLQQPTMKMRKLLIITSSNIEFDFIHQTYKDGKSLNDRESTAIAGNFEVTIIRSDPGIFSMVYFLSEKLHSNKYDLVLNAGVCGSFNPKAKIGDVFRVNEDLFADIGTEEGKDLFDMKLLEPDSFPFKDKILNEDAGEFDKLFPDIRKVRGITVNRVSQTYQNISFLNTRYRPEIETMEGAAFFYTCLQKRISCIQLRSVSNAVGERDKDFWDINKAMKSIQGVLGKIAAV